MRCFKNFFQHTWHPQQMVVMASFDSIWDYPNLNQDTGTMGMVYGIVPGHEQHCFPPKSRIPDLHMESLSRFELTKTETRDAEETELAEVKTTPPTNNVATSTGKLAPLQQTQHTQQMQQAQQPSSIPCRNRGCKSWSGRSESRLESPWHFLKTVFLISVIVALVLWVIVYTFLAQYRIL